MPDRRVETITDAWHTPGLPTRPPSDGSCRLPRHPPRLTKRPGVGRELPRRETHCFVAA
jgi:hypothetical protein